ncbi:NYN domain-containing protein [Pseudonocardia sp. C8]|nr:NYN domain-containing protein [Pseudonocardia sp. C8]
MPAADVPGPLRRFAKFTPAKRARLGGQALVTRLEQDPAFRAAVVAWWAEHRPGELELPDAGAAGGTATGADHGTAGSGADRGTAAEHGTASDHGTGAEGGTGADHGTATDHGTGAGAATGAESAPAPVTAAAGRDAPLPAPVDRIDAAAVALLTGDPLAPRWVAEVERAADLSALRAERDEALAKVDKVTAELERVTAELAEERERARSRVADRESEYQQMRRRVSEQGAKLRAALDARAELEAEVDRLRAGADERLAAARAQCESERERADQERRRAESAAREVAAARQAAREARRADEVRLELLIDTVGGAIAGLRRELDIGAGGPRPADLVAGGAGEAAGARAGVPVDGLAALDTLLAVPSMHLIVDGYNVSKTGYPDLPLADQRSRLVGQLGALGARTGVEITVVFDGAAVTAAPMRGTRGVRVLFSEAGVLADDVLRDLVAAEPAGRPLLVATSDQEVVRSVRRRGAHTVPSAILLRRLGG